MVAKSELREQPVGGTRFNVVLEVQPEPRLTLSDLDGPFLTEAVDDRGRSLLPESETSSNSRGEVLRRDAGSRRSPVTIDLNYPESPPGTMIRTLRGSFTATVAGPELEPLVIPLKGAEGQAFQRGLSTLTVNSILPTGVGNPGNVPAPRKGTRINMTLRAPYLAPPRPPSWPSLVPMQLQPVPGASPLVEVRNAEGRLLAASLIPYDPRQDDGVDLGITAMSTEGLGPPATLHYFAPTWATVEIPFVIENIPMP